MLLSQEYLLRYGLNCPIVFRPEKERGFRLLFLSTRREPPLKQKWVLLNVHNKVPNQGPPYYSVDWTQPQYNSGHNFQALSPSIRLEWDQYDQHMVQMLTGFTHMEPVIDQSVTQILCWEIFLYCNDDAIASLPIAVQRGFWRIVDDAASVEDRLKQLAECTEVLPKYKQLSGRYGAIKSAVCDHYANWLGELAIKARSEPEFAKSITQTI